MTNLNFNSKSVSKASTPSIHLSSIYWQKLTVSRAEDSEINVAKHLPGGIHTVPGNPVLEGDATCSG